MYNPSSRCGHVSPALLPCSMNGSQELSAHTHLWSSEYGAHHLEMSPVIRILWKKMPGKSIKSTAFLQWNLIHKVIQFKKKTGQWSTFCANVSIMVSLCISVSSVKFSSAERDLQNSQAHNDLFFKGFWPCPRKGVWSRKFLNGTPVAIWTQDPLLRRQMLYPTELRALHREWL